MSDFGWSSGGQVPHNEPSNQEHFKQVGEAVRHEREANKTARPRSRRRWWRFWVERRD